MVELIPIPCYLNSKLPKRTKIKTKLNWNELNCKRKYLFGDGGFFLGGKLLLPENENQNKIVRFVVRFVKTWCGWWKQQKQLMTWIYLTINHDKWYLHTHISEFNLIFITHLPSQYPVFFTAFFPSSHRNLLTLYFTFCDKREREKWKQKNEREKSCPSYHVS